jgi:hypothetical protein
MENQQNAFESELQVENMESYWKLKTILYRGYFNFVSNHTELIGNNMGEIIQNFVVMIGKGPLGLVKGVGYLGQELVWYMVAGPGGWFIIIIAGSAVLFSIGGILYVIRNVVWIISIIIKNIYNIFSYIFRKIVQ